MAHEHSSKKGTWEHEDHKPVALRGPHGHGSARYVGPVGEPTVLMSIAGVEFEEELSTSPVLVLRVQCVDDVDASNMLYQLFGPYADARNFGEEVSKHEFTLSREG